MNNTKDKFEKMIDKFYLRIAKDLSEGDIMKLEVLDLEDKSGKKVEEFLISKFPNYFDILREETEKFKQEAVE